MYAEFVPDRPPPDNGSVFRNLCSLSGRNLFDNGQRNVKRTQEKRIRTSKCGYSYFRARVVDPRLPDIFIPFKRGNIR